MKYMVVICAVAVATVSAAPQGFASESSSIPSMIDIIRNEGFLQRSAVDGFLDQTEVELVVADGLEELMKSAVYRPTGMEGLKNVNLVMNEAVRQILESRRANGIQVRDQQFENLRGLDERFTAIFDALKLTFATNEDPISSVDDFLNRFELDAVETATFYRRIVPTISKIAYKVTEESTPEYLAEVYDICLVAMREALETREANGRPMTDQNKANLALSDKVNTILKQIYVPVVRNSFTHDFIKSLKFNPEERAKFITAGYYAVLDAIYKYSDASVTKLTNEVTLAYITQARLIINDRISQGVPVDQDILNRMDRIEALLPIIAPAYEKVNDDAYIP